MALYYCITSLPVYPSTVHDHCTTIVLDTSTIVYCIATPIECTVQCSALGPTDLKSTVGQYSRTDHTNTVMVARLEPPIPGTTIKIYPPSMFDHWADLPTAVNDLSLTAINLPLLSDLPTTDLNKPLKNKSILKSTMKNIFPPASAPRVSRSTSEGADPVAFDDNVDIPAALGASPISPTTRPPIPPSTKGLWLSDPLTDQSSPVSTSFLLPTLPLMTIRNYRQRRQGRRGAPPSQVAKPISTSTRSTRTSTKSWLRIATSTTIWTMSTTASFQSSMQLPTSRTSGLAKWLQLLTRLQRHRPLLISQQLMTNLPNRALPLT